jgi:hypothetical protein
MELFGVSSYKDANLGLGPYLHYLYIGHIFNTATLEVKVSTCEF